MPEHVRSAGVHPVDVFIDLSSCSLARAALESAFEKWARAESLGAAARRVTCVVEARSLPDRPPRTAEWTMWEPHSLRRALNTAMGDAAAGGVPLLLLTGLVDISAEALELTCQCLGRDPMFGFAIPRIGCNDGCCLAPLSRHGVGRTEWLPRKILAELPERELMVEIAAPCVLVGHQILGNFGPLSREFESLAAAVVHYMAGARRCGFRTVLCNRAVVGIDGLGCDSRAVQILPVLPASDLTALRRLVPDLERSWREFRSGSWERFETLCASIPAIPGIAGSRADAPRPSLLIDVRNVGPFFNGTVQAVLGVVAGVKGLDAPWDVSLLASPEGEAFHDLRRVYDPWTVYTTPPDGRSFTITLRLSQPWHISEMVDVHRLSLLNAYMLLDTINWDIGYSAPPHLEGTWQFMADHADAFLFDSGFTRERFVERFPSGASVPGLVTHFSFAPSEYISREAVKSAGAVDSILVIGNSLDHKDVGPTVDALASAFPFRRISVLGPTSVVSPFVTALNSGDLPESDVQRLYASAQYVVCPSFYEGFGFPIVTALAYGRTVLARRSALLEEIAARCERRGRLIVFDRREELVDLVGKLVHGQPVPEYPLGTALSDGRPQTWRDVAMKTLTFLEAVARRPSHARWIARERVVHQLLAYRT